MSRCAIPPCPCCGTRCTIHIVLHANLASSTISSTRGFFFSRGLKQRGITNRSAVLSCPCRGTCSTTHIVLHANLKSSTTPSTQGCFLGRGLRQQWTTNRRAVPPCLCCGTYGTAQIFLRIFTALKQRLPSLIQRAAPPVPCPPAPTVVDIAPTPLLATVAKTTPMNGCHNNVDDHVTLLMEVTTTTPTLCCCCQIDASMFTSISAAVDASARAMTLATPQNQRRCESSCCPSHSRCSCATTYSSFLAPPAHHDAVQVANELMLMPDEYDALAPPHPEVLKC
jgi:hypothetical protein